MKRNFLLVTAVFISSHLFAQQDSTRNLDEVVITATKTPVKQSQTGKVVIVIDQETLQRGAGKNLTEILNYQAGVFVNGAANSPGTNPENYVRGAAPGNTLILIDGVPVNDPSYINNSFDLNTLIPAQIERVEILKGAQSTLWGSDAVAGVINIITKKNSAAAFVPSAALAYGSYNTVRANAGINGRTGAFNYNLNYSFHNSDGFSSAHDTTGVKAYDKDGFNQHNVQLKLGYNFNAKWSLATTSIYGKYKTDLDAGAFADDKDFAGINTNGLQSVVLKYSSSKTNVNFSNSLITTERHLNDDSASIGGFAKFSRAMYKGTSLVSELFANHTLSSKWSVVAGVQRVAQNTGQTYFSISSFGPYESAPLDKGDAKTTNYAAYASVMLLNLHGFNAEAGVRYNNHSIYGSNATYSFNPSFNIDEHTRVFVNISSAYKVPSLYQLYSEFGNKDLQPEQSNNYEVGVQSLSSNKRNSIRLVGFKRDIRQLIVYYTDPVTYASYYINRDLQEDYGFEIESNVAIGKSGSWVNNVSYVDGEGKVNDIKVKNFYRRPNFTFYSTLSLQPLKALTLMPSFRFVGSRLKGEFDAGPTAMPHYYTVDFYAGWQIAKKVKGFIDFRNITDQQFFDVIGYNSRGANCTVGLNFGF